MCHIDLISPSLLANILKRSKKCHERFRLGVGERTESSDESSAENESPKSKPPKKLKLSVPKDKEIDGNLWSTQGFSEGAPFSQRGPQNIITLGLRGPHNFVELCCLERWAKRLRSNP